MLNLAFVLGSDYPTFSENWFGNMFVFPFRVCVSFTVT